MKSFVAILVLLLVAWQFDLDGPKSFLIAATFSLLVASLVFMLVSLSGSLDEVALGSSLLSIALTVAVYLDGGFHLPHWQEWFLHAKFWTPLIASIIWKMLFSLGRVLLPYL